jgi:tetratricopeptide (TPR) repeat protein
MTEPKPWFLSVLGRLFCALLLLTLTATALARPRRPSPPPAAASPAATHDLRQNDSVNATPAKDLQLQIEGEHKADALAHFVEATAFEENGEIDKALEAYRKVLNVDPSQSELAAHVADLLAREDDFPQAIDVLKDAIAASPNAPEPYLQLAFIYAKYLKKTDQAVAQVDRAIAINPHNIEAYQRLYEIEIAAGEEKKALQVLDRASKLRSDDPNFWAGLGKLYAAIVFKPDVEPKPADINHVNELFEKAVDRAADDPAVLKDVADYYAASQQIKKAIPLYLRVLELQPDDLNAREKLASGFVATNQRAKAVEMLESVIGEHPEKYQPYDLLAEVLDDEARALERSNQVEAANATFKKAAANYEQSLLINPAHLTTCLRLAELLLGPVKDAERAVGVLSEARRRFPNAPEIVYYLALAQREAKHPQQAVATFEEARHEAEMEDSEIVNARFYFNYGATAEQAGLYEKAADLFRKAIAMDPANAADACNYLGYMWVEQNQHLDEAEAMIKRAVQSEPNNGAFLDSLGWLEFRQGKFEQALNDLQRAAKNMTRDDPVVFEHIGDTCLKLQRVPQALEAWQKALTLDPQNKSLVQKIESTKTMMSKGEPQKSGPPL